MSIQEEILKELKEIKSKPALNGGFDKLVVTVENIKEKQIETTDEIKDLKKSLYEPEKGLFSKTQKIESDIKNSNDNFKKNDENLDEHFENDKKFQEKIQQSLEKLDTVSETAKKLQSITGGVDLKKLEQIINLDEKIKKMFWLLLTAVISTFGKFIVDLITK